MSKGDPCQKCLGMAWEGIIRSEAVMPLEEAGPLAQDGTGKCCHDCASADNLARFHKELDFEMARIAVANDRQEQLRMPESMRPHMGLAIHGYIRLSKGDDALRKHCKWLDKKVPWWRQAMGEGNV